MKLLVILAVVGVANCAPHFGAHVLEVEKNAAGQITDVDLERGSVAVHAAAAPFITSYSAAAASPLVYNAPALSHAVAPTFYNLPATNLAYTHTAPIAPLVYRAPNPVVYHAPAPIVYRAPTPVVYHAPAPLVVQAPPTVIVRTVQAPAPAPIVKTVYVNVGSSEEDDTDAPTVYTRAETSGESDEVDAPTVYTVVQTTDDSEEDK